MAEGQSEVAVLQEESLFEAREVVCRVNGRVRRGRVEPRKLLSDFLRDDLGLHGTHVGCEHGICGTCTVIFNGYPARSCLMFAVQAEGADIVTVEGLAGGAGALTPLQESFSEVHALQCGYCTPGMLMVASDLLRRNPAPTEEDVREVLSGQLCRCTGYDQIVRAVLLAAERMGNGVELEAN